MCEQQDAVLRQATADLLRRAPGHELECPSKLLFQNAREDAAPPDPSFRQVVDEIHGDEELAFAKDFSKYFVLPIAYNVYMPPPPVVSAIRHCGRFSNVPALQVLQHVCDSLDSHFASSTVAPASFAKLLKSNACVARHYALSNRLCQLANPFPLDHCRGRSSAAATAAHVTLFHSAAFTSLNLHNTYYKLLNFKKKKIQK